MGEEKLNGFEMQKSGAGTPFIIVQAAFESPITMMADIVFPSAIWAEQSGTLTNLEGRVQKMVQAVPPAGDAKQDWEIISLLAEKLGKKPATFAEASVAAIIELTGKETE